MAKRQGSNVTCMESAFTALTRAQGEADVRDALHDAFKVLGVHFSLEYPLESGPVDMADHKRRVLVETKARGQVGPMNAGAGSEETQKDQVERYLRDAREHWLDLFREDGEPRAFLTDGLTWWGYEIGSTGRLKVALEKTSIASHQELADLLQTHVCPEERRYRVPAPENLVGQLLTNFANDLESVYRERESDAGVQTKMAVWKECLRGTGVIPSDDKPVGQANLFVRHSVLVVAARVLKTLLQHGNTSKENRIHESISDGFCAWVTECAKGRRIIDQIAAELDQYEWRGETRDRLKEAYHKLIERNERKEFGEYYTPDWLAARVVEETLDETWMDCVVADARSNREQGLTVLDPACGSGTFLFHAARRLFRHIRERHPKRLRKARAIIATSVVGMDVHPIAVEMAEATLEMALPPPSPHDEAVTPQVFLGDALQTTMRDDLVSSSVSTKSARGTPLTMPLAVAVHPKVDTLIGRLVEGAVRKKPSKFTEIRDDGDRWQISRTQSDLTKVIRQEDDHVWKWHLRNLAAPVRLAYRKAGRIVANPPWLMANDTPDGSRKNGISALREEYGLRNRSLRRSSTEGDLAAVFTARAADLYLTEGGRMGLVLPGGALQNQNWAPWRTGCWHGQSRGCHVDLTHGWGLDNVVPPPFQHAPAGCCVVFAHRLASAKCHPRKTGLASANVGLWSGDYRDPQVTPQKSLKKRPSDYEGLWSLGVLAKPHGLFYVLESHVSRDEGLLHVVTKESTKKPWTGLSLEADIEAESLHELARPQKLTPFVLRPDAHLIAPLLKSRGGRRELPRSLDDPRFRRQLPKTWDYWSEAERRYQEKRSAKAGETLLDSLDWRGCFVAQIRSHRSARTKVVYNESGQTTLRGARVPSSLLVNGSLYWLDANTTDEALYLVGIINAPCLQEAWRRCKTSRNHFDMNPWRSVPVPRFDSSNAKHRAVVRAAKSVEQQVEASGQWDTRRASVALLNKAVRRLLTRYANLNS